MSLTRRRTVDSPRYSTASLRVEVRVHDVWMFTNNSMAGIDVKGRTNSVVFTFCGKVMFTRKINDSNPVCVLTGSRWYDISHRGHNISP